MNNQPRFNRIQRLIGDHGLEKLKNSFVAIVGLGAVGSYAVEGLARSGVGHLRLIDFDNVSVSNINRQLYALESTVGKPKIEVARQRVLDINPECQVETHGFFVHVDHMDAVLAGPPDLVIDAIDSLAPKVELLAAAVARSIPVISSMGAALRRDPSCVRVGPLGETKRCPLARHIRKKLRKKEINWEQISCVYSIEKMDNLPEQAMSDLDTADFDAKFRGRVRRTLGSLPTITGIFGLTAANAAIDFLLKRE